MNTPITMVGTIGTVPERRSIGTNGTIVCRFRLACSERRFDRETNLWIDGEPNWLTVIAYRGLAEHAHGSFNKGDRVIVNGRLRVRPWQNDDGKSGVAVEIEADSLGHDLRWGTSKFTRSPSPQSEESKEEGPSSVADADVEGDSDENERSLVDELGLSEPGELVGAGAGSPGAPF